MIILNDELKNYLSKKYSIDKKLIYHFGYDDDKKMYKIVYHSGVKTLIGYINPKEMRNFTLRLKIQKLINSIKIKDNQ